MPKRPNHLDRTYGFINETGLLSPCDRLQTEHGIRPGGNEIGNQNGQRRNTDYNKGNSPVDTHHKYQGSKNGHSTGKQLRESHQKSICKGIHIRNHPADQVSLGVAVQV